MFTLHNYIPIWVLFGISGSGGDNMGIKIKAPDRAYSQGDNSAKVNGGTLATSF